MASLLALTLMYRQQKPLHYRSVWCATHRVPSTSALTLFNQLWLGQARYQLLALAALHTFLCESLQITRYCVSVFATMDFLSIFSLRKKSFCG